MSNGFCTECKKYVSAVIFCLDCMRNFCASCYVELHKPEMGDDDGL